MIWIQNYCFPLSWNWAKSSASLRLSFLWSKVKMKWAKMLLTMCNNAWNLICPLSNLRTIYLSHLSNPCKMTNYFSLHCRVMTFLFSWFFLKNFLISNTERDTYGPKFPDNPTHVLYFLLTSTLWYIFVNVFFFFFNTGFCDNTC